MLTTNGPAAKVAENPLLRHCDRVALHHAPGYFALRKHLMDFLVMRSKTLRDATPEEWDARRPPTVRPVAGIGDTGAVAAEPARSASA